jgi:hypothetical protein
MLPYAFIDGDKEADEGTFPRPLVYEMGAAAKDKEDGNSPKEPISYKMIGRYVF